MYGCPVIPKQEKLYPPPIPPSFPTHRYIYCTWHVALTLKWKQCNHGTEKTVVGWCARDYSWADPCGTACHAEGRGTSCQSSHDLDPGWRAPDLGDVVAQLKWGNTKQITTTNH